MKRERREGSGWKRRRKGEEVKEGGETKKEGERDARKQLDFLL